MNLPAKILLDKPNLLIQKIKSALPNALNVKQEVVRRGSESAITADSLAISASNTLISK